MDPLTGDPLCKLGATKSFVGLRQLLVNTKSGTNLEFACQRAVKIAIFMPETADHEYVYRPLRLDVLTSGVAKDWCHLGWWQSPVTTISGLDVLPWEKYTHYSMAPSSRR